MCVKSISQNPMYLKPSSECPTQLNSTHQKWRRPQGYPCLLPCKISSRSDKWSSRYRWQKIVDRHTDKQQTVYPHLNYLQHVWIKSKKNKEHSEFEFQIVPLTSYQLPSHNQQTEKRHSAYRHSLITSLLSCSLHNHSQLLQTIEIINSKRKWLDNHISVSEKVTFM